MNSNTQVLAPRCVQCGALLTPGADGSRCLRCALGNALGSSPIRDDPFPAEPVPGMESLPDGEFSHKKFGDYELVEELARIFHTGIEQRSSESVRWLVIIEPK